MNKKIGKILLLLCMVVSLSTSVYSKTINNTYKNRANATLVSDSTSHGVLDVFNILNNKESTSKKYLIPVGNTVGIKINTDGILVLGTGYINTVDGTLVIPAENKVYVGDIIYKVNGEKIQTKEQLEEIISNSENVELVLYRDNEVHNVSIKAEKSIEDDKYKIGLWVRDTTQGIGTISFIDPETNEYYALGHGIMDIDTNELMKVKDGEVLACNISSISKGTKGVPGEIIGEISIGSNIGTVKENVTTGVVGTIENYENLNIISDKLEICDKKDIEIGRASILTNVENGAVEKYDINILQIDRSSVGNKNMVIEIIDEDLLNKTSGIVQGMSGSPIIQNDKIVGVVTHVFVNDPTKGYGVFVENMIG